MSSSVKYIHVAPKIILSSPGTGGTFPFLFPIPIPISINIPIPSPIPSPSCLTIKCDEFSITLMSISQSTDN